MKYIYTVLLCLFLAVTNIQADNLTQPFSLVPCPVSLVPGTGNFHFSAKTSFAVENEGQAEQVRQFTELLTRAGGFTPRIKVDSRKGDVCLVTDATLKSEAYKLEITIKKITIRASDLQGFPFRLSGTIGRCGTFFLPQGKLVAYYRLYGNAEVEQVTSASGR